MCGRGGSGPGSPRALFVPGGLRRVTIWRGWGFGLPPCSTLRSSQVAMRCGQTLGNLQGPQPSFGARSVGVTDPPIGPSANRSLGDPGCVNLFGSLRRSPSSCLSPVSPTYWRLQTGGAGRDLEADPGLACLPSVRESGQASDGRAPGQTRTEAAASPRRRRETRTAGLLCPCCLRACSHTSSIWARPTAPRPRPSPRF